MADEENKVEENKKVVERFEELIVTQELDLLDELCTPDLVNHALAADRPAGLAGTHPGNVDRHHDA